ncbi:acyltransferase family protein [Chitinophaga sp. NPDC101104]|uniref:acyltransferase family protein n=1 Tax=Chitinophaga sp. NPDC101104 TaxID=3390561 RepID=UPI003CFC4D31
MATHIRQHYLDWLRVFAIIGVLLYHAARPFMVDDPWHINNAASSEVLTELAFWLSRFRMHLLFFISGAVTWYMMRRRTAGGFVALRFRRLFIPLAVGMFLIVPPQVYMERVNQGFKGNFLDFYGQVLRFQPYPKGDFSWHHLWFIAYLFLYDILLAPFFAWAASPKAKAFTEKLRWFAAGKRVYLLMLPSVVWFSAKALRHPGTNDLIHDYCYFPYWMLFVVAGFLFMMQPALMDSLERNRRTSLTFAFVLLLGINYLRWNDIGLESWLPDWETNPVTYLYIARWPLLSWCWVMALTGYGKRYLSRWRAVPDYVNQSVYPFYILHQTIIVIIAFYVVKTGDTIGMKYLFITIASLLASVLIIHLFIRPFAWVRLLMGMKTGAVKEKAAEPEVAHLPQVS